MATLINWSTVINVIKVIISLSMVNSNPDQCNQSNQLIKRNQWSTATLIQTQPKLSPDGVRKVASALITPWRWGWWWWRSWWSWWWWWWAMLTEHGPYHGLGMRNEDGGCLKSWWSLWWRSSSPELSRPTLRNGVRISGTLLKGITRGSPPP